MSEKRNSGLLSSIASMGSWFTPNPSQSGRRVLITGANSGIGFETARELVRKGAEIILPARSMAKAKDAAYRIRTEIRAASVIPCVLDLASQASVREFASWFSRQYPGISIDLLINNAGVMAIPKRELTLAMPISWKGTLQEYVGASFQ